MSKKILYIDMDGVVADFDKAINQVDPSLETGDGFPNYEARAERVDEICENTPLFFDNLPLYEDCLDYVNSLFNHYEVYFLSTPMWNVPESFSGKRRWIEKHFGEKAKKRLILSHRKDLNVGDYLIDDRLRNGAGDFKGELIHFQTEKFPNWETVYEYLTKNL